MRLPRVLFAGALYHVCSRGNNQAPIFLDDADRAAFRALLQTVKAEFGVRLFSYLLLNDHFQLLIETPNGDLSKVMQRLNQGYTRYFNKRHGRTGHVFENRYKCRLVQKERYLMQLIRYMHLVPVKQGLAASAAEYLHSSHGEYAAPRPGSLADWQKVLPQFAANLDRACMVYGEFLAQRVPEKDWKVLDRKRNGILGDSEFRKTVRKAPLPNPLPVNGERGYSFHEERS